MLIRNGNDYSKGFFIRRVSNYSNPTKLSKISDIAMGREEYKVFEIIQFIQHDLRSSPDKMTYKALVSLYGATDGLDLIAKFSRKSDYSSASQDKYVNLMTEVTFEEVYSIDGSGYDEKVCFMDDDLKYTGQLNNDYFIATVVDYQLNHSSQHDYRFIQNF